MKMIVSGYGVSKVVSPVHSVAAPVSYGGYGAYGGYGGYGGNYGGYGGYGGYGVSKVVSPVTTLGMCVVFTHKNQFSKSNYCTLINFSNLHIQKHSIPKKRIQFIFFLAYTKTREFSAHVKRVLLFVASLIRKNSSAFLCDSSNDVVLCKFQHVQLGYPAVLFDKMNVYSGKKCVETKRQFNLSLKCKHNSFSSVII